MKTLDRYVIRSFLQSLLLLLVVMMTLRVVIDLFVNMDEFAESDKGFIEILHQMASYYGYQSFAYFAQLGGVILVASAAFTIAQMNRTNELTAMMASGVSLHRVLLPIIVCSVIVSTVIFLDRELVIPPIASKLVRSRDDVEQIDDLPVWLLTDGNRAVWYSQKFIPVQDKMVNPLVIIRDKEYNALGKITGTSARPAALDDLTGWFIENTGPRGAVLSCLGETGQPWDKPPGTKTIWTHIGPGHISANKPDGPVEAHDSMYGLTIRAASAPAFDDYPAGWVLREPRFIFTSKDGQELARFAAKSATFHRDPNSGNCWLLNEGKLFFTSDLTAQDIKFRRSSRWLDYMSIRGLNALLQLKRVPDPQRAVLAKHIRITEPINNLLMLLVGIPFILSRERNVKASAMFCLGISGLFYAFIHLSRYIGLGPIWAAWLPVLVFGPIAAIMIDSIKT